MWHGGAWNGGCMDTGVKGRGMVYVEVRVWHGVCIDTGSEGVACTYRNEGCGVVTW